MAPVSTEFLWDQPISIDEAAKLLGVTPQWVRQLIRTGHIERIGRGRTTAASAVRGMVRFWEEKATEATKGAAGKRVHDARAAEIERRMAREDREIITMEEALATVDLMSAAFVAVVSGLPNQITRNVNERRRIEAICDAERDRLAQRLAEGRTALEAGIEL